MKAKKIFFIKKNFNNLKLNEEVLIKNNKITIINLFLKI